MNIYICTKPLQIMICMILSRCDITKFLYIVDAFSNSQIIASSKELRNNFSKILWFRTKKEAFEAAANQRPNIIYIDGDVGVRNLFDLYKIKIRSLKTEINVYEEGVGTYRTDLIKNKTKKWVLFLFGVGVYYGGCFLTKKIFLFEPNVYIKNIPSLKNKVVRIDVNFCTWLHENKIKLLEIFSPGFAINIADKQKIAYLYLSSWSIDLNFIDKAKMFGVFFVKLHPHIKNENLKSEGDFIVVPNSLPAEVAIILILEHFERLVVYHSSSSSLHYVKSDKIKSLSIDD